MAKHAAVALAAGLLMAVSAPVAAWAQAAGAEEDPDFGRDRTTEAGTRFRCQDGGDLLARFATQRGRLVAIVDALDGYGPHTLAWRPYEGGPVMLTWSDGERTLTWSPGVQIMWMAADTHRMCGRAGGHNH